MFQLIKNVFAEVQELDHVHYGHMYVGRYMYMGPIAKYFNCSHSSH